MYCSFRFYLEECSQDIQPEKLLSIFSIFSDIFKFKFEHITCFISDRDSIETTQYDFTYDEAGISALLNSNIINNSLTLYTTVTAGQSVSQFELYSDSSVKFNVPSEDYPMKISVDFKITDALVLELSVYSEIISRLEKTGFKINNSLCHIYRKKKSLCSLDRGQFGTASLTDKLIINSALQHSVNHEKDRILDSLFSNSITLNALEEDDVKALEAIVGRENCRIINNNLLFRITNGQNASPNYFYRYMKKRHKLRKIINE